MLAYNFEDKLEKLKKQLHWWKARNLTLKRRVLIIKALGLSKFAIILSVLHIPNEYLIKLNTEIYKFIWKGKTDKVKRKIAIQNYDLGGIKMTDVNIVYKAAKCKWISKYLNCEMANWKNTLETLSLKKTLILFLRSNFDTCEITEK